MLCDHEAFSWRKGLPFGWIWVAPVSTACANREGRGCVVFGRPPCKGAGREWTDWESRCPLLSLVR
jgi:hypothetical protein